MLKKLRNKLLLINMISISLVIILSFAMMFIFASIHLDSLDSERLRSVPTDELVQSIIVERENNNTLKNDNARGPLINPNRDLPIDSNNAFVVNIDEYSGMLYVFSRLDLEKDDYSTAVIEAKKLNTSSANIKMHGQQWKFLFTGDNDEYIVFLNVSDTAAVRVRLMINLGVMALFVLAVVFVVSFLLANRAIRPADENFSRQKRFIADASHELKTPLAIIDASAEAMLADNDATIDSQNKWLNRIGEESTRMRKLIDSLLFLAKSEDSTYDIVTVDLTHIINDEIGRVEAILFEKNVELVLYNYQRIPILVKADYANIGESILILLDNAVKYTESGGKVIVETGTQKHLGYVKISNSGEEIPREELPKVFDRFYRVDNSRSSSTGGYGLGLSIAKAIVERSEGNIYANSENGFTSFTIELPLS